MTRKGKTLGQQLELLYQETWKAGGNLPTASLPSKQEEFHQILAELAGAVAHELFQPLTAISINIELLMEAMAPEDPGMKYMQDILAEIERMVEVVGKLGQISCYETKPYLGKTKILDLEKSVESLKT